MTRVLIMARADKTKRGRRYRPTRPGDWFDARGRTWLTRTTPGVERNVVSRWRKLWHEQRATSRDCWLLAFWDTGDGVLMRRHCHHSAARRPVSDWIVVPRDYVLREVKR